MRSLDRFQKVEFTRTNRRDRQRYRVIARKGDLCARMKRQASVCEVDRRTCSAPWPLMATKMQPLRPSGSLLFTDRFGQPMRPRTGCPSTINAKHTAYCPPRKNPFVPSIGSSVHRPRSDPSTTHPHSKRSATHVRYDHPDLSHGRWRPRVARGCIPSPDRVPNQRSPQLRDRP